MQSGYYVNQFFKNDVVSTIIFGFQLAKHHLTVYALFKSPGIHFSFLKSPFSNFLSPTAHNHNCKNTINTNKNRADLNTE